jgi:hypothetical protein
MQTSFLGIGQALPFLFPAAVLNKDDSRLGGEFLASGLAMPSWGANLLSYPFFFFSRGGLLDDLERRVKNPKIPQYFEVSFQNPAG